MNRAYTPSISPANDVFSEQPYQDEVDRVIAICGGDMRGALQALLAANEFLETEICLLRKLSEADHGRINFPNRIH